MPFAGAKSSQRGIEAASRVPGDAIRLIDRDVETIPLGVLDMQVLALDSSRIHADEALEAADTVIHMHDVVAWGQG